MLARRLLVFVAVLLGLTALAAGLAAPPPREAPEGPVIGTRVKPATPAVEATIDLAEPRTVAVEEGDEVRLTVTGDELDTVELTGLDLLAPVAPETPAVFDVLADRAGTYNVRLVAADRRVGRLRVTPAKE